MKKKLLAVAVVGALASPLAFADVTITGGIDVGFQNANNYTPNPANHNFISSGQDYTSRLIFKGSEDLGSGLSANWMIDSGISADVGGTTDGADIWARQTTVGLSSKEWGTVDFGRNYTQMFSQYITGTYSVLTLAGNVTASGVQVRQSNYVKYVSPTFNGVSFGAGWSPGSNGGNNKAGVVAQESTTANIDNGKYWDAMVRWAQGQFAVAFSHSARKTDVGATNPKGEDKRNQLSGKWDNGTFGLFAGFANDSLDGTAQRNPSGIDTVITGNVDVEKIKQYWIQPVYRFSGSDQVFGVWGRKKFEGAGDSAKTTWWGVAYRHYLSKKTWVYAGYGTTKNDEGMNGAPTTFAASSAVVGGQNPRAIQAGVATTF